MPEIEPAAAWQGLQGKARFAGARPIEVPITYHLQLKTYILLRQGNPYL